MIDKLIKTFGAICIGTVVTQIILIGYFLSRGTLNSDGMTKIVALLNGIDISGDKLVRIMNRVDSSEQPDFNEILQNRTMQSLDMDLRLRSQKMYDDELTRKSAELQLAQERFDKRREAFERKLDEVKLGAQEEGMKELIRTMQALESGQAKEQLMKIYDAQRIDDVVNIIQGIPIDKRKDIMAEFDTPAEQEIMHEIMMRIADGLPTTQLIDQARTNR